ncbi:MAG: mannose-6-phosphate isomerase, partial [Eudoraea sp.]|nr:mannose-6-phosphate isomerase [Eudoraea sp.]
AEIQQTSDITYRVYDYDRVDAAGNTRELHTELALEAISFEPASDASVSYEKHLNKTSTLVHSPYFKTNILPIDGSVTQNLSSRDSFKILMSVAGEVTLEYESHSIKLPTGTTCLLPASLTEVTVKGKGELLEITL